MFLLQSFNFIILFYSARAARKLRTEKDALSHIQDYLREHEWGPYYLRAMQRISRALQ